MREMVCTLNALWLSCFSMQIHVGSRSEPVAGRGQKKVRQLNLDSAHTLLCLSVCLCVYNQRVVGTNHEEARRDTGNCVSSQAEEERETQQPPKVNCSPGLDNTHCYWED